MCLAMRGAFKRRPKIGRPNEPNGRFPNSVGQVGEIERHLTAKDKKKVTRLLAKLLPVENTDDWSPCRWSMHDFESERLQCPSER